MLALLSYITINLDPVLIKAGPFSLRWYGLMYVLGIAVGLVIVLPYARQRGLSSDQVWNIFWGVAIAALIGGRLYYVLQNDPGSYLQHPGDIFAFWQGGMAYFGAVFLGVPVLLLLARQQRVPLGVALDCAAIFAPLAQAVGRVGNIINGDIYGYPSTLPWATSYTNAHSFAPLNTPVQPAAAYELLFSVGLFLVLWPLRFRLQPAGMLFVLYMSLYCVGQFILFIWRDNDIVALNLKQAQITAVAVQALLVIASYVILQRPWWFDPAYAEVEDDYDEEAGDGDVHDEGEELVAEDGRGAPADDGPEESAAPIGAASAPAEPEAGEA